ncbi:MAG TPA: DUF389 domain-containing protein [Polyangium sp.]|nr:DUF389 domain-containing protein [Polyangium sp.]
MIRDDGEQFAICTEFTGIVRAPEIAARASPTALDLLIAILCAIAVAYATIRPGTNTAGTAAGTAMGIALVPPLCVVE